MLSKLFLRALFQLACIVRKNKIARAMYHSPEYFAETMFLIEELYDNPKQIEVKERLVSNMLNFKETSK